MDDQEIALNLTIASIEWLQQKEGLDFKSTIDNLADEVVQLYSKILKAVKGGSSQ